MNTLIVPASKKVCGVASRGFIAANNDTLSPEEQVTLLLMRDLVRLGWRLRSDPGRQNQFEFTPPYSYQKQIVKQAMAYARNDILAAHEAWISRHIDLARRNLASGIDALASEIRPRIEECRTEEGNTLFRMFRYYWSSPYSDYVGRRLRLLIRDDAVEGSPVIGIAALGSSIIHIPDRDNWIGWDVTTRTRKIIYMMDAYVLGAVPPYNHLLGGKLISYILASNEVRSIYREKYRDAVTLIDKRNASDMVLIVTTSLYGRHSSQYNRMTYSNELLYQPIGETAGYGTLHISDETFRAMRLLLVGYGVTITNRFGDGANWRMRIIRTACEKLGLDSETILRHSFRRGLFAVPLAHNWRGFLNGVEGYPIYKDFPMDDLVNHWKNRWLNMRKSNDQVQKQVAAFKPEDFTI